MIESIKLFSNNQEFINYATPLVDETFVLLMGEKFDFHQELFDQKNINYHGALYPFVIFGDKKYDDKLLSIKLNSCAKIELIEDISKFKAKESFDELKSLIILADGLSSFLTQFLEEIFDNCDVDINILGGGAGRKNFIQKEVIFSKKQRYKDAAIIIKTKEKIHYGANHGWEYLKGPFLATSSSKNVLHKIDYKNAFSFYKEIIQDDLNCEITQDNFFNVVSSYPLGVLKYKDEYLVRDPILYKNSELKLVGDIPQNSLITILKGNRESVLEAALKSADELKSKIKEFEFVMMFDCISREIYIKDEYEKGLELLQKRLDAKIFGVGTIGEFANDSTKYIDVLNKCCVLGASKCC